MGQDGLFGTGHADVDVLAEDNFALRHPPERLYDLPVAFLVGDLLVLVAGERMGAGRSQGRAAGRRPGVDPGAQLAQMPLHLGYRLADRGLGFEDGLEQLVRDQLGEVLREAAHDLLYLRDQLSGRGVHDVELLFYSQGVATATVELYRHGAASFTRRPR